MLAKNGRYQSDLIPRSPRNWEMQLALKEINLFPDLGNYRLHDHVPGSELFVRGDDVPFRVEVQDCYGVMRAPRPSFLPLSFRSTVAPQPPDAVTCRIPKAVILNEC